MATVSTSPEFTGGGGGGVTWEEGIIWKVSEGLVGGLGMSLEYWAAAAASTSATAATVFKNSKNKKNDHHLRSPVGAKINNTSPPPLSATLDTDATTITILTTSVGSKVGGGRDVGMAGEGQDELGGNWLGQVAAAATHPFVHVVAFLSAFLLLKRFFGSLRLNCRSLKKEVWILAWLVYMAPIVFARELWLNFYLAAHTSEEYLETGITNRGIGGITLVSVEAHSEGRVGERHPRMPGRGGSGGSGKKSNQKRSWKAATNKFHDFLFTLNAFIVWVRDHVGSLAALVFPLWPAKLYDGLSKSSSSQQSSDAVGISVGDDETETNGSAPGSDNEGGDKNGKNKGTPKKGDSSGGQGKKSGKGGGGKGGGKGKKGRKR